MITKGEGLQIAKAIVSDYFPELASKRIKYLFVSGKSHDYYMAVRYFGGAHIYIEKEILQFSREAFTGCLAHELGHILIDSRKSFLQLIWGFIGRRNRISDERAADALVIERGLGNALLRFHSEHEKEYYSYIASEGMTRREIKKSLKSRP